MQINKILQYLLFLKVKDKNHLYTFFLLNLLNFANLFD